MSDINDGDINLFLTSEALNWQTRDYLIPKPLNFLNHKPPWASWSAMIGQITAPPLQTPSNRRLLLLLLPTFQQLLSSAGVFLKVHATANKTSIKIFFLNWNYYLVQAAIVGSSNISQGHKTLHFAAKALHPASIIIPTINKHSTAKSFGGYFPTSRRPEEGKLTFEMTASWSLCSPINSIVNLQTYCSFRSACATVWMWGSGRTQSSMLGCHTKANTINEIEKFFRNDCQHRTLQWLLQVSSQWPWVQVTRGHRVKGPDVCYIPDQDRIQLDLRSLRHIR